MIGYSWFGSIVRGESRLFALLGTNVTLGGLKSMLENTHKSLESLVPACSDLLVIIQVAIGLATLVYMILKIKKIASNKKR
jgi:hypothetical protein